MLFLNGGKMTLEQLCRAVVNESLLSLNDYGKHKYKYVDKVISILLSGGKVKIKPQTTRGAKKDPNAPEFLFLPESNLSAKAIKALQKIQNKPDSTTVDDFDKALEGTGITWSRIEKTNEIMGRKEGAVKDKSIGPQALGIVGKFNKTSLLEAIKNGLEKSAVSDGLKTSLIYLSEQINKNTDDFIDLDEMILNGDEKVLTYDLPDTAVDKDALKSALNEIGRDFGEIIGGIFLLNYLKDAKEVFYSDDIAEKMIDYQIISDEGVTWGISAKAGNTGAPPSASEAFKVLQDFVTSGAEINGMTFDELLHSKYIDKPDSIARAKAFFNIMLESSKLPAAHQYIKLIEELSGNNPVVDGFCKLFGFAKISDMIKIGTAAKIEKEFDKRFKEVCADPKKYKELVKLRNSISQHCGNDTETSLDSPEDAAKIPVGAKVGMFIKPLLHYTVNEMNREFGLDQDNEEQVDIISAFLRLAFSHKQIYTKISILNKGSKVKIVFKFDAMDTGNWKFAAKSCTGTEPWRGKLTMTLFH